MAQDSDDEGQEPPDDPTEVRVQWRVPAPTPEGEEPATPWGRPVDDEPDEPDEQPAPTAAVPVGEAPPAAPPPAPPSTGAPPTGAPPVAAPPVGPPATDEPGRAHDVTTGGPDDRRRRVLVVTVIAVAAVAALVAGALVVVLATRDDDASSDPTTTTTTTQPTTAPPGLSGEVDIGAGITALIPAGALTDDAAIEAEVIDLPRSVGPLVTPIGDTVQITLVRGRQLAPIGLRFPFTAPPDLPTVDGVVPPGAVFALHRDAGTWIPLPVDLDEEQGTATFETPSLSPFGLFTWSTSSLRATADGVLGGLVGEAASELAPSCSGQSADVSATGDGEAVAWCAEEDGVQKLVRIVNVSEHAVSVRWSAPAEAEVDEATPLGDQLTDVEAATGDRVAVLGPGGRATIAVPDDATSTVTIAYDGSAHTVTGLLAATRLLEQAAPDMPWSSDATAAEAEAALAASGCAAQLLADMDVGAGTWRAALGSCVRAEHLGEVVADDAAAPVVALLRQLSEPTVGDHAALVDELQADTEVELVLAEG